MSKTLLSNVVVISVVEVAVVISFVETKVVMEIEEEDNDDGEVEGR